MSLYAVLGLDATGPASPSEAEIRRAYRRLALKYHPDKNPDDNEAAAKFAAIKNAYEQLINPSRRATEVIDLREQLRRDLEQRERKSATTYHRPEEEYRKRNRLAMDKLHNKRQRKQNHPSNLDNITACIHFGLNKSPHNALLEAHRAEIARIIRDIRLHTAVVDISH